MENAWASSGLDLEITSVALEFARLLAVPDRHSNVNGDNAGRCCDVVKKVGRLC